MEIILLEKIQNLGTIGDQVKVRGGYGRNYLIPQGKAVPATAENIETFETRKSDLLEKANSQLANSQARAEKIKELTITISSKAGDEGKLYGSIGARDIAAAITEAGVEISKSEIQLPNGPIRNVGEHEISLQIHADVNLVMSIEVIAS